MNSIVPIKEDPRLTPATPSSFKPAPSKMRGGIGIVELMAILRRRGLMFGLIVLAVMGAGLAASLAVPPKYTAVVEIKVDPSKKSAVELRRGAVSEQTASAFIATEIGMAKSRKVSEAVVAKLALTTDPEFRPEVAGGPQETLDHAVDTLLSNLAVSRQGATYIVDIAYTSKDADKAATIANAVASEYMVSTVLLRREAVQAQAEALKPGLDKLEAQARSASAAAAGFRANASLSGAGGGSSIAQQQAGAITVELSSAEGDLAAAQSDLRAARAQIQSGNNDAVGKVLDSPVVQDLRRQRAEVMREFGEVSARYGPRHPAYVKVEQQKAGIERQLADEGNRVVSSLEARQDAAQSRVATLQGRLSQLQGTVNANTRAEAVAINLDRDADAAREVFTQYNLIQHGALQQKNLDEPQAIIVSAARVPQSPSFPNIPMFTLLGALVGVVLGGCAILLAELFNSRLNNGREVEEALGFPYLGSIPLLKGRDRRVGKRKLGPAGYVLAKPLSAYAESLRAIRSGLLLADPLNRPQVIAIASALPGEGKTSVSLAFARVLGMGGAKVVVLDCDLRRSALQRLVSSDQEHGLVEALSGAAQLSEALRPDDGENVWLLPLAQAVQTPRDIFGGDEFRDLLSRLRRDFDFIVIDTPPVLAVADARGVARQADSVVFLCRWSKTPMNATAAALNLLEQDGAHVAGVALNGVDLSARSRLAAGKSAYYYKAYRKYYEA